MHHIEPLDSRNGQDPREILFFANGVRCSDAMLLCSRLGEGAHAEIRLDPAVQIKSAGSLSERASEKCYAVRRRVAERFVKSCHKHHEHLISHFAAQSHCSQVLPNRVLRDHI